MPPTQDRNKSSKNTRKSSYSQSNRGKHASLASPKGKASRGLVRIIAGTHRGRRLPVLISPGLRPTSDRVKETLFNWLMSSVSNSVCLDMFAGSGALGIEALSRGASKVVFIEQDKTVAQKVTENLTTLREIDKAEVHCTSALTHTFDASVKFNVVFIDPPFAQKMVEQSIDVLLNNDLLAKSAYIYIETGHNDLYEVPSNLSLVKQIKTSQVFACLFQFNP